MIALGYHPLSIVEIPWVRTHIRVFSPVLPRRFSFVVARIYEFLFTKFGRVWFVGGSSVVGGSCF